MIIEIALGIVLAVIILTIISSAFKSFQEGIPYIELVLGLGVVLAGFYGIYYLFKSWYEAFPFSLVIFISAGVLIPILFLGCKKLINKLVLKLTFPGKELLPEFIGLSLIPFSLAIFFSCLLYWDISVYVPVLAIIFLSSLVPCMLQLYAIAKTYLKSKK